MSTPLKDTIADRIHSVLPSEAGLSRDDLIALIEVPSDAKLGDYAFPCFRLAKTLKKAPPLLAQELVAKLGADAKATGPYVNFFIDYGQLAKNILANALTGAAFKVTPARKLPRTMIEFSQPNTHKAFHVGHCRNVALGDALVRMNRYLGYDVVAANYIGDEGTHIAKCLWYYMKFKPGAKPEGNAGEWLGGFYTAATQMVEDAPDDLKIIYQKEISTILQKIEGRDPAITKLWEETKEWSMDSFREIYSWLGVKFDHYFYESEVTDEARKIVEDGLKSGVFVNSQGAVGVDLNDLGLGFCMVLKSDGTTLYSTRDLALARRKFEEFKIERSIYVVANEQELHFKQVFKILERMGFPQVKNCHHLSYGLVMIPSGKMSSRLGNVIYFSALREGLLNQVKEVAFKDLDTSGWSASEVDDTAQKIAVAAIRYGMIASDPKKTIIFDMPQWLSFVGDTGPYLLYTYVRMRSILRKGEFTGTDVGYVDSAVFQGAEEKALLKRIINLNATVERAVNDQAPAPLACFLFDFCQEFNSFYAKTSILKQDDPARKNTYLVLVAALAETLKTGAGLLGIDVPERM